jgi:hypothetical protein
MKAICLGLLIGLMGGEIHAQIGLSAGKVGAVGFELPLATNWGEAKHFPQASYEHWQGYTVGARVSAFPGVAGMQLGQIGAIYRRKIYHSALYADFFGDALFGWQHYHFSTGLPVGKIRLGAGLGLYRWWVNDHHSSQWQGKIGLSGTFKPPWKWHLAFQMAAPQSNQETLLTGAPPSRAFLALEHRLGPVNLWATYQHQAGMLADYGLAMIWKINHKFQFDVAAAPRNQRVSMGFMWTHVGLQWHLQARWQQLPGLWYDNSLIWRSSHVP